jgi:FKBP-type peptidyl-prolyl cis-trans isomerase FklB
MKKIVAGIVCALISVISAKDIDLKDLDKKSYIFASRVYESYLSKGIEIDNESFYKGLVDAKNGVNILSKDEIKEVISKVNTELVQKAIKEVDKIKKAKKILAKVNSIEEKDFLEKNAKKEGVNTLESGVQYKVLQKGSGKKATLKDTVSINYVGKFINGKTFHAVKEGSFTDIKLNGVIKGWKEIIPMMQEGSKWEVYIPSELGYGQNGLDVIKPVFKNVIPPNTLLVFTISLDKIK